MSTPSATEVLQALCDPDSWFPRATPITELPPDPGYAAQISAAREKSGQDESIAWGTGTIAGQPVVLIVGDFAFLAGSIGYDAAERIIAGFEFATREGLPVIGAPISGGTRMQEGTPAFLRMAAIAAVVAEHQAAGLPYLTYLRHPTTGGVFATWGSLGQITFAQPGALIGFLGPRVYEEVSGEPFPAGVQTSENLHRHGLVDAVVELVDLRPTVVSALTVWSSRLPTSVGRPVPAQPGAASPWERILTTRAESRPGFADLLALATDVVPLNGTGQGEPTPGLAVCLARLNGAGVVLVGQDRADQRRGELIGPWSLRTARRGMALAQAWGLPLITVVDTPGAELSAAAEEGAMAGEIARCLVELSQLTVPTASVLLGEGTGGGALALLPTDYVIATQNAWLTPLPPEGAAAIVHRDATRAPELAAQQHITAEDLTAVGAVDLTVTEDGDWIATVASALTDWLAAPTPKDRQRWRSLNRL